MDLGRLRREHQYKGQKLQDQRDAEYIRCLPTRRSLRKTQLLLFEVIFSDRRGRDGVELCLKKATPFTYLNTRQQKSLLNWINSDHQPQSVTNKLCKNSVSSIPLPWPQHQRNWFGKWNEVECISEPPPPSLPLRLVSKQRGSWLWSAPQQKIEQFFRFFHLI